MTITTAQNDQDIDVRGLNSIRMFKWEDESWTTVTLSANFSQNDRISATPYFLIPCYIGTYDVYIECQGDQAVKSIGGKADGCWGGIIAYDTTKAGWQARTYSGCSMQNYKESRTDVCGHPDVDLNGCKFKANRAVECDYYCSFRLVVETDGYWALQAPPVMKDSDFNYEVSYGGYTNKTMEWGAVSIAIDEVNNKTVPWNQRGRSKPRKFPFGVTTTSTTTPAHLSPGCASLVGEPSNLLIPEKENSGLALNQSSPSSAVDDPVMFDHDELISRLEVIPTESDVRLIPAVITSPQEIVGFLERSGSSRSWTGVITLDD